ncbi:AAA domain-containing protein [Pullulanibacillus sp. KACC 23026]|uniref:DEAD/DEAH box helicase n=1 Tax=Pullulanibacillus sp. KACC 23026 TaxID=3028315 RepID=UPI0023B0E869|nr:AAA domain-containing protein [Pullulanibacillus sp. KACC 23026]WEG13349.1 AAA domain-containing protein [Pullulanibacillus sp. KACC 23026]
MGKDNLAEKVLDYWYALEFLSQDAYPESRDVQKRIESHKEKVRLGTSINKTISNFIPLSGKEDLYEVLSKEANACGMKKWGNLTIYIGKVKREKCIECISKMLPFDPGDENRPEKSTDKIAWVSLQLSPNGNYIEHSLSLSTIIWALNQIRNAKGNISDSLDDKLYNDAMEKLEKKFFDKESTTNANNNERKKQETNTSEQKADEEEKLQAFSASAISLKKLRDLYEEVEEKYIKGNIRNKENDKNAYEEIYGISYQLFADETTKKKKEDDNYLGLNHDYYSDDIKLVIERERSGALVKDRYMGNDILKYVTVLEDEDMAKNNRINLVDPKKQGEQEYLSQINEILSVENAPLGKWPSRFMPAFMQQMAVNLAIGKGTSDLYKVNGKVFSVNGPPGTGKTTLLKEIVVSNIIERAILLSKYDDPNDAFVQHDFIHGEREENAYSTYTRHWYSLKNDAINNYSMLVTSCNNAAVENISKELPKSMVGDLEPLDDDSEELRNMLVEVGKLFDPDKSGAIETTHQKETYKDVYFTKYAQNLLGNDKAWGLIAAPLGKKSNLSNFYNHVLNPLGRDFYQNREMAPNRVNSYKTSKKKFEEQLKVVRDMQNTLRKAGNLFAQKAAAERVEYETVKSCNALIAASRAKIKSAKQGKTELIAREEKHRTKAVSCKTAFRQVDEELINKKRELKTANLKRTEFLEKEVFTRKSVGVWIRIFSKAKYEAAMKLADEYKKDAENQRVQVSSLDSEIKQLTETCKYAEALYNQTQQEYDELKEQINSNIKTISAEEKKIVDCESEIAKAHAEFESVKKEYESEIAKFAGADAVDTGLIIDEEFVRHLLSNDVDESTIAQVSNPWFTERYNREREKLFGYAMRMNKEFVVSTHHCRDNFVTLSHYWGLKAGDENERIIFHKEDKAGLIPALFQTLFLLVPVLSSTFASVGTFLRDVKHPGVIGMLVVDEAGQAQPQMALGALYRSRSAVIVGDPKQVEPVVTDDLILLKKAYSDEALKPYKKKSLSVQGFADRLNTFGTYLDNGTDYPEWIGCPLLVHRRCISPMYDVSNEISYNGIMKQQTRFPGLEKEKKFIYDKSQWINVKGSEKGKKNHFVETQGQKVCELLEIAFSKNPEPSIYIISPFTTVVSGIKDYIEKYCRTNRNKTKINSDYILDYNQKKIGTVHTFQGKEAEEVIFLLGCDTSEDAKGAIQWVNKNIVNVAATRAKFRLYVIGDEDAWKSSTCISMAKEIIDTMSKEIIDTLAIKEIKSILEDNLPEQKMKDALVKASRGLPSVTAFSVIEIEDENGVVDYSVDTSGLIKGLKEEFLKTDLSKGQLERFGFNDMKDLDGFPIKVKENLLLAMKLFFMLEPVYQLNKQLDASCCAILFCKVMELQMKDCFTKSLKEIFPDYKVKVAGKGRDRIAIKDSEDKELTLGTFYTTLKNNRAELGQRMKVIGKSKYDEAWWISFEDKLGDFINKRNKCFHSGLFSWREQSFLLFNMFKNGDANNQKQNKSIGGILFESKVGKNLEPIT